MQLSPDTKQPPPLPLSFSPFSRMCCPSSFFSHFSTPQPFHIYTLTHTRTQRRERERGGREGVWVCAKSFPRD